jgi:acyl-CoA thioesterase-2
MADDYRIDLERCTQRAQVWAGDVLLAESERCTVLHETRHVDRLYFPPEDVKWEHLTPTQHHSSCPFKGSASYWDVIGGDPAFENVAWSYQEPIPDMTGIERLIAFYQERVRVVLLDSWPDGSTVAATFPVWDDATELVRLMDVQPTGENRFQGPAHGLTPRNVVEGGQLLGEAIVAASKTVPGQRVTSASMIFSKAASFDEPVELDVDVLRGGRSFSSVEVRISQGSKLRTTGLLLMDAGSDDVIRGVTDMPDLVGPEEAVPFPDFGVLGRDIRVIDAAYSQDPDKIGPPEINVWVRFRDQPTESYLHAALLAQSTTHWTIAAALLPHPGLGEALAHISLSTGVMKATVAFHDEVDVSDWLLYTNRAIWAGRGQAQGDGRVFTRDGRLVASYSIQTMIRAFERDPAAMGRDFSSAM